MSTEPVNRSDGAPPPRASLSLPTQTAPPVPAGLQSPWARHEALPSAAPATSAVTLRRPPGMVSEAPDVPAGIAMDPTTAWGPHQMRGRDGSPGAWDAASAVDVALFRNELGAAAVFLASGAAEGRAHEDVCESAAAQLIDQVDAVRDAGLQACTFQVEVPGWGSLLGQVVLLQGHAEVELWSARSSAGALLRGRAAELQRQVERESRGDVRLFVV